MKTPSFALPLTAATLMMGLVLSCSPTQVPSTVTETPEPQASVTPSPDVTPVPEAPPLASSPSPTPGATATPVPSITPFPEGQPNPSSTPLPTPSPVFGNANGGSEQQVTVSFRARVITDNRQVLPVVNANFTADPYNLQQLRQELAARNNAGARPQAPSQSDAKYQVEEKVCNSSGCTTREGVDMEAYQEDLSRYHNSILPEWEARAYAGLEAARTEAAQGRQSLSFSTNERGEATLRLLTGTWYFNGRYSTSGTVVVWESVPFEILPATRSVELVR